MRSAHLQKYIIWFSQTGVLYNNLINMQASLNQSKWFNTAILRKKQSAINTKKGTEKEKVGVGM